MASMSYYPVKFSKNLACGTSDLDLLRTSSNGLPLKTLEIAILGIRRRDLTVSSKLGKVNKRNYTSPKDADSNVEGEVLMHLSSLEKVKPKPVTLEFEKPLIALQKQIIEVRKMAIETGLDFSDQILSLESNYEQVLKKLYMHLNPTRRVNIGGFKEGLRIDPKKTVNLKKKDTEKNEALELEQIEELSTFAHSESDLNMKMIEKLEREVGHEYSEAAKALGLKDKLVILHEEFAKTWNSTDQNIDPALQDKIQMLNEEFIENLPHAPNYASLKFKLDMLKEISEARDLSVNKEIEEKFREFTNQPDLRQNVDELNEEHKMSTKATETLDGEDEIQINEK